MKTLGMILIGAGILALLYSGFNYTTKKRVVDIGPIEIDKKQNNSVNWPPITGAILVVSGIVLLVVDKKKISL